MAKLTHLLDDIKIRHWIAKGEAIAKSDGDGLTFTLSSAGTASWVLRYRYGGRRKELTIGNYPDITLAAARKMAREQRANIDKGADPAADKRNERAKAREAWTVRELAADFREKCLDPTQFAAGTITYRNYDLDKVIIPVLGSREVRKITPSHVVEMIINAKRTWTISKRLLTCTSLLFDHACGLMLVPSNPCMGIKLTAILGPRPAVKKRLMLTEQELRNLMNGIEKLGKENALSLKILLATCVRTTELMRAKKVDIDLNTHTWWIPDHAVKTRSGTLVPLVPQVEEWFKELIEIAGDSQWVLPTREGRRNRTAENDQPVGRTTLLAAINRSFERNEIDSRRFTPHDTRSTAKGHMMNMGISREISEIALNHKLQGMDGIYDVRQEIPERREALELWAKFIDACATGGPVPARIPRLRLVA